MSKSATQIQEKYNQTQMLLQFLTVCNVARALSLAVLAAIQSGSCVYYIVLCSTRTRQSAWPTRSLIRTPPPEKSTRPWCGRGQLAADAKHVREDK